MTKKSDKMNEREEMDEQTLGDELLLLTQSIQG